MTREIVLDTETTGLDPATGDRVVELGCVELVNHVPTGRHFHAYFNPERAMAEEAYRVHGLSDEFLRNQPRFGERAAEFLQFIEDSTLIAHNASFDTAFLDAELERAGFPKLRNRVLDTVTVARDRHPGARVSLDALCKHYGIDNSRRTLHGALLDSQILAEVYLELIGGRQVTLALVAETTATRSDSTVLSWTARPRETALATRISAAERLAHMAFVATLGPDALWGDYADEEMFAAVG